MYTKTFDFWPKNEFYCILRLFFLLFTLIKRIYIHVCIMCLIKDECKYAHIVTCYQFLFARIRNTETNKRIKQQNLPSVEICMRFVTKSLTNLLGSFSAQWMVRCASIYDPDPGSHKFLSYFCSVVLLFCCVFVSLQSLLIFFSCATHPKAPFKSYIGQL